ncbi:MAG: hypothetical protein IJI04_02960 [Lachnospiraceae bacterium]|nr:hypothetical protein [Lachnospiraceae bacterium]
MKKYLEIVGFDMSELDNENRSIYLSTLESCKTDPVKRTVLMGRRPVMQTSYKSESYKGFDINANGAKEATKKYKDCDEGNKKYNDGLNIVFRTEESANKEKEEAIKAEEAAKAAKDKKPRKR